MRNSILFLFLLLFTFSVKSQTSLYGDIVYGMSKRDAHSVFKSNKDYKVLDFGNDVKYYGNKTNITLDESNTVTDVCFSTQHFYQSNVQFILKHTYEMFLYKEWYVVVKTKNWNIPIFFDKKSDVGVLLKHPTEDRYVNIKVSNDVKIYNHRKVYSVDISFGKYSKYLESLKKKNYPNVAHLII